MATLTIPTPTPMTARPEEFKLAAKGHLQTRMKFLTSTPHADRDGESIYKSTQDKNDVGDDDAPSSTELGVDIVTNEGCEN